MATDKENETTQQGTPEVTPRPIRPVKVVEAGEEEQGEPVDVELEVPTGRASAREAFRKAEKDQLHHGGIPLGADVRE